MCSKEEELRKQMSVRVCLPASVAPPASIIDNMRLTKPFWFFGDVCVYVTPVCRTGAPVTQGHSCETPLIPLLRVFWVGGRYLSAAQLFVLVTPNIKKKKKKTTQVSQGF